MRSTRLAALLAFTFFALPAGAQNVSTGIAISDPIFQADLDWSVEVLRTGGFLDRVVWERGATVISPRPSPWQANLPGSFQWIGAHPDGTLPSDWAPDAVAGGGHLFDYLVRRTLSFGVPGTLTYRCAVDNGLVGIRVDGLAVGGGCGTFAFGGTHTVDIGPGTHRLTFHLAGDGVTDGLLVDASFKAAAVAPTTVPEPATVVLMATGLALMAGVARRKRRSA